MPPKSASTALSLAPSAGGSSPSPFGRSKMRGPKREEVPDGRALREATKQIQEDRQQSGFNKLFAKHPPTLEPLVASLRRDHDPKDVTTVVIAIRHMLQQIKKSPKYCLHRFHRLLAAVSVIRKAYFESRMRFVIRIVTLCERWSNLERSAPRQSGPISRAALAAALDEKWDLGTNDMMATLRKNERWQPHMCPLMIKRAVLLSQFRRMKEEFIKRWRTYKVQQAIPKTRQPRRPTSVKMELGGVRAAFVPVESVFHDDQEVSPIPMHNQKQQQNSSLGSPISNNNNNNNSNHNDFSSSSLVMSRSYLHKPVFAQTTVARQRDPNEPRFPWYTILHSLNLQQLIDLTLRTHKHEERLARLAEADAMIATFTTATSILSSPNSGLNNNNNNLNRSSLSRSTSAARLLSSHGGHDPRRMSMVSGNSVPRTEAESFDSDVMTNAVDEYCSGLERDWVAFGHEMEARISSEAKKNGVSRRKVSPAKQKKSPTRGGGGGAGGVTNRANMSLSRALTPAFIKSREQLAREKAAEKQQQSVMSFLVNEGHSSQTPPPPSRPRILPPMSSVNNNNNNNNSGTNKSKRHGKNNNNKNDDSSDDDDDKHNMRMTMMMNDSSSSSEDDGIGGRRKKISRGTHHGAAALAEQRRKRRNQEVSAQNKMEEMKNMGVLSKFFDWNARPRVDVSTRIKVSSKYHEKLLKIRTREMEKGKSVGQNVVTDHLCLHQLEPFRDMDHMTRSLFMRGIRKPLKSTIDESDSKNRTQIMSRASKELATAQELDQIIAVRQPPAMRFALH